ncbi:MAG: alpha amylase C-terminal domain-containing protein, partial [Aquirufa sp.]
DAFYQDLFKRAAKSDAIAKGAFFDLQYSQNETYPNKKVYSFLRYTAKERLLIVCNFDAKQGHSLDVVIPDLAKEMMGVKQVNFKLEHAYIPPHATETAKVSSNSIYIPANSALFIKL